MPGEGSQGGKPSQARQTARPCFNRSPPFLNKFFFLSFLGGFRNVAISLAAGPSSKKAKRQLLSRVNEFYRRHFFLWHVRLEHASSLLRLHMSDVVPLAQSKLISRQHRSTATQKMITAVHVSALAPERFPSSAACTFFFVTVVTAHHSFLGLYTEQRFSG